MKRFEGKLAVVTGANSGIGRATALRLAEEGANVLAVDVLQTAPWPSELADMVQQVSIDLCDVTAPGRIAEAASGHARPLHVLVNVAGILRIAPFLAVQRGDWDQTVSVNLTAVFFLTQALSRVMIDQAIPGRIVNVSSVHAVVSEPNAVPYTATKGGLEAMTRTIATELAEYQITANCVRPGATRTAMSEPLYTDEVIRSLSKRIPLGMVAPPEWVAAAICYLASEESRYTTGACLDVDGGYGMNGSLPGASYAK